MADVKPPGSPIPREKLEGLSTPPCRDDGPMLTMRTSTSSDQVRRHGTVTNETARIRLLTFSQSEDMQQEAIEVGTLTCMCFSADEADKK